MRRELDNSQYRLRKAVGILGIALPVLSLLTHEKVLPSMSYYYYAPGAVFFIGILTTFGLLLLTYEGFPRLKESDPEFKREIFSDNTITTLAGICILIVVFLPTRAEGPLYTSVYVKNGCNYLFGHNNEVKNSVHLISAGFFLVLLGCMCFSKFTLNHKSIRTKLYKICGIIIWVCVGLLILAFAIMPEKPEQASHCCKPYLKSENYPTYVFWLESIAVWAFGIAWLVKGRFDRDLMQAIPIRNDKANQGGETKTGGGVKPTGEDAETGAEGDKPEDKGDKPEEENNPAK